ncbi:MAG: hypothetical protein V2B13_06035, partial [Pseudomonadota bacterium]
PMAIALDGSRQQGDWEKLAQLCLTYSDAPEDQELPVQLGQGDRTWQIKAAKVGKGVFREWMI